MGCVSDGTGSGAQGTGSDRDGPALRSRDPESPGFPASVRSSFQRDGLLTRIWPFATVALLAELSLALPPGPQHPVEVWLSLGLLAATAGAIFLPWERLPGWMTVVVPLLYTCSALPVLLASGGTGSGIAAILFIPLVWTALFHRPWESACVVAGILAVLFVASFIPHEATLAVIFRRLVFWGALATMIAVAGHGLRARIRRSREATARLQGRLRELSIMEDRDRIASSLQDTVVQRLFASGLSLQGIRQLTGLPEVGHRIDTVVHNLDEAIRLLRQSIFGLEHGLPEQGLRRIILDMSNELAPSLGLVPEVTLDGPIDTEVPPRIASHLLAALREALSRSGAVARATRVAVAVVARPDEVSLTVTDNGSRWSARASANGLHLASLRDRALRLGGTIEISGGGDGNSKLIWRVPLTTPPASNSPSASQDASRNR